MKIGSSRFTFHASRFTLRYRLGLIAVLLLAFALRMVWTNDPGYVVDVDFFARWMRGADRDGIAGILSADTSYPPATMYALWALGRLSAAATNPSGAPPVPVEWLFLQIGVVFCDLLTVALLATMGRRTAGPPVGLAAALLYALCPGGIYLAGWWRQIDAWLILPLLLAGWWLSRKRIVPAWLALGLALTVKLQAALLVPIFAVGTWRWRGPGALLKGGAVLLLAVAVTTLPVVFAGQSMPLLAKMTQPTRDLQWISLSSHNLWYALTPLARDVGRTINRDQQAFLAGISFHDAGLALLALGYGLLLARLWFRSRPDDIFPAIALAWFTLFCVTTRMHVRYIYPALPFLLCSGFRRRRWWGLYAIASITLLFNLVLKSYTTSPLSGLILLTPARGVWNAWIHVGVWLILWGLYLAPLWPRQDDWADVAGARGWELWLLVAAGLVLCGGVAAVLARGRSVGTALAQIRTPLVQSLDRALAGAPRETLVVNWPGAILAGDSANLFGAVPVTPPALFLDTPDLVERPVDWVQFGSWQQPLGWDVEYYGTHVTAGELAGLVRQSERVVAFQPPLQEMVVLAQPAAPVAPVTCPADFAGQVCLVHAQATQSPAAITLALTWQVTAELSSDVTVFVHVLDAAGAPVAQADGDLIQNLLPLAELPTVASALTETRVIALPPGEYRLSVGLYHRADGQRLPLRCASELACAADAAELTP